MALVIWINVIFSDFEDKFDISGSQRLLPCLEPWYGTCCIVLSPKSYFNWVPIGSKVARIPTAQSYLNRVPTAKVAWIEVQLPYRSAPKSLKFLPLRLIWIEFLQPKLPESRSICLIEVAWIDFLLPSARVVWIEAQPPYRSCLNRDPTAKGAWIA